MNNLIEVRNENGELLVSARELHKGLDITERFNSWFERMLKYGFEENLDFVGCKVFNTQAKQELQEYVLKIDMAKEIAMIQRNEKGKMVRKYFIECEKKLREQLPQLNTKEMLQLKILNGDATEKVVALGEYTDYVVEEATKPLINENEKLTEIIDEYEPKVEYVDEILKSNNTMTVSQIAKDYDLSAISLNRILHDEKVQYKTGKQWLLYAKYVGKGYTKSETHQDEYGNCYPSTKWTQKGRLFIHQILTELGYKAIMDM